MIIKKYQKSYQPIVSKFINDIKDLDVDGIPEPFLPVFGESYHSSDIKIAFCGMETNSWGELSNFINREKSSFQAKDCQWHADDFSDVLYGKNGGLRTFWSFVTQFLAIYHASDRESIIKNDLIMQSFVWGNCNSIERLEVINKNLNHGKKPVQHETWAKVKDASAHFDHGKHIINIFKPDLMIITYWSPDESYLTKSMGPVKLRKQISEYLLYMEFEETDTRVIWTAHPSYLRRLKIEKNVLSLCVKLAQHGVH